MPIEHSFLASQPLFGLVTHGVKCCVGKLVKDTFTIATSGSHAGLAWHNYYCSDKLFVVEQWAKAVRLLIHPTLSLKRYNWANLVKMKPIRIELESGASFAVISVLDMDATLNKIRKQIQEEVSELVPEDFYFISSWGPPTSRVQEAKITLNETLQDEKLVIWENINEMRSLKWKAADIDESETTAPKAASRSKRAVQSTLT